MINRIHILGASGSGTTTLGQAMASELGYIHLDVDDYFWLPTDPPYSTKRDPAARIELLKWDTQVNTKWILTGSMNGWGDILNDSFDLVIFLYLDPEIRLKRLAKREAVRHGFNRISIGGDMHEIYRAFIEWAAKYDYAGIEMRSLQLHEKWLQQIKCPVLRIDKPLELPEKLELAKSMLS